MTEQERAELRRLADAWAALLIGAPWLDYADALSRLEDLAIARPAKEDA